MAVADREHLWQLLATSTDTVATTAGAATVAAAVFLLHLLVLEMRLEGRYSGDRHVCRAANGPQLVPLLSQLLEIPVLQTIQQA